MFHGVLPRFARQHTMKLAYAVLIGMHGVCYPDFSIANCIYSGILPSPRMGETAIHRQRARRAGRR